MIREIKINNPIKIDVKITYLDDIEEYNAKIIDPKNGNEYEGEYKDNKIYLPDDWYKDPFNNDEDYISYLKNLFNKYRIPFKIQNDYYGDIMVVLVVDIKYFNIIKNDMKQLNEVARMQQLAGINEIKVNNPLPIKDGTRVKILVNVYYDGDQTIPEYELDNETDDVELYIKKGTIGTYFEDEDGDGEFIDKEGSDTRIEKKYLERI